MDAQPGRKRIAPRADDADDVSPERMHAEQLVAGIFGENIDERNRPFIERSAEFNRVVGGYLFLKGKYRIPDSVAEEFLGYVLDLLICVGNSRIDTPEEPPKDEDD